MIFFQDLNEDSVTAVISFPKTYDYINAIMLDGHEVIRKVSNSLSMSLQVQPGVAGKTHPPANFKKWTIIGILVCDSFCDCQG